jgi:hypothetical protein
MCSDEERIWLEEAKQQADLPHIHKKSHSKKLLWMVTVVSIAALWGIEYEVLHRRLPGGSRDAEQTLDDAYKIVAGWQLEARSELVHEERGHQAIMVEVVVGL